MGESYFPIVGIARELELPAADVCRLAYELPVLVLFKLPPRHIAGECRMRHLRELSSDQIDLRPEPTLSGWVAIPQRCEADAGLGPGDNGFTEDAEAIATHGVGRVHRIWLPPEHQVLVYWDYTTVHLPESERPADVAARREAIAAVIRTWDESDWNEVVESFNGAGGCPAADSDLGQDEPSETTELVAARNPGADHYIVDPRRRGFYGFETVRADDLHVTPRGRAELLRALDRAAPLDAPPCRFAAVLRETIAQVRRETSGIRAAVPADVQARLPHAPDEADTATLDLLGLADELWTVASAAAATARAAGVSPPALTDGFYRRNGGDRTIAALAADRTGASGEGIRTALRLARKTSPNR